jgi:hypothetical protein
MKSYVPKSVIASFIISTVSCIILALIVYGDFFSGNFAEKMNVYIGKTAIFKLILDHIWITDKLKIPVIPMIIAFIIIPIIVFFIITRFILKEEEYKYENIRRKINLNSEYWKFQPALLFIIIVLDLSFDLPIMKLFSKYEIQYDLIPMIIHGIVIIIIIHVSMYLTWMSSPKS